METWKSCLELKKIYIMLVGLKVFFFSDSREKIRHLPVSRQQPRLSKLHMVAFDMVNKIYGYNKLIYMCKDGDKFEDLLQFSTI